VIDTDLYFVEKLKENDKHAFELLFKKYYKHVYGFAGYYIDDKEACHDIVQDIFGHLWEMRNTLKITGSVKSYLFVSTKNACLNYLKKQSAKRRAISELFDADDYLNDGYDIVFSNELKLKLDSIMQKLPPQCREIFHLSRFKGMKHKEIADKLNISPKTVETQIYRALKVFKSNLQEK